MAGVDSDRSRDETGAALSSGEQAFDRWRRTLGLGLGPLAFVLLLAFPVPLPDPAASRLAAVVAWVLVWWISEAIPLPATAVLAPCLALVVGAGTVKELFAPFGDPVIFLFLGSFLLAEAATAHGLDRRLAFGLLASRLVAGSPARVMVAFAGLAAFLSMWLSNSATTAMLYPIALGVTAAVARRVGTAASSSRGDETALLLVCAYAASIGGIATPVGTPPNLIAMGQLATLARVEISFLAWMLVSLPIMLALLAALLVLTRLLFRPKDSEAVAVDFRAAARELGPLGAGERNVLMAFAVAVTLWVVPGVLALAVGAEAAPCRFFRDRLPESVVACLAAGLLFVLPVDWRRRLPTLTWARATRIDWGTLLLFGGGLSLGGAMFRTGLADALGTALINATGASSSYALTALFTVFAIYFTEVTSNTATATMLTPLAIAAAQAAGISPLEPAIGCALGCSMAFMLPVATPPNAIVYGSGRVPITAMVRTGFWLNLVASAVIPCGVVVLVPLVLG